MPGEELDMGYANRDDDLHDYDPGRDETGIFPIIRPAPGPAADRQAGYEWYEASPPGHYRRPGGCAAGPPPAGAANRTRVIRQVTGPERRPRRPSRMRPDRWVIAVGSITGAVAVYVAFTTAGAPAKPMPSPFTPAATTQLSPGGATPRTPGRGAPARPVPQGPVNCVIPGP